MARSPKELIASADRLLNAGADTPQRQALRHARAAIPDGDIATIQADDPRLSLLEMAWKNVSREGRRPPRRTTYVLVALSILTMYIVACTTIVHNKGVSLLAEIEALAATKPERRFAELERQLLTSHKTVAELTSNDADPLFIVFAELKELDTTLHNLNMRVSEFSGETVYPAPGMATLAAMVTAPLTVFTPQSFAQQGSTMAVLPCGDYLGRNKKVVAATRSKSPAPSEEATEKTVAALDDFNALSVIASPSSGMSENAAAEPSTPTAERLAQLSTLNKSLLHQACEIGLWHIAKTTPSVSEWATRIRQITSNYSLWLVPGLYAALGALIFFMRQILDDERDNPAFDRIFLRIAIAGMAGIVVGWMWNPSAATSDARSIGASLFVVSFVVGYGIEIFFEALDRLVERTTGALNSSAVDGVNGGSAGSATGGSGGGSG